MRSQENGDGPSPSIPVIAGFTPINRHFSPVTSNDTNPGPVSVPAANKGKKRQKEVSASAIAKPTAIKSPRPRQSKKAKQVALPKEQTSAHAFTVSKPSDRGSPVHQKAGHGDVLEPSVPASASGVTTLPVHRVLQTSETSPSTEGLSSTYQAAFPREHLPIVSEEDNGFPPSSYLADEDVCRTPCSSCLQPAPTSDGAWTQDFHLSDHATGAVSGLKSVSDNTLASSNGLASSYSGAMVSGQQYLLEPNHDHGDIATLAANGLTKIVPMEAQLTNTNPGYCDALDLSQFDDFLTRSTQEDCSPMDVSEPFGQTSETKCTSDREVVPETLSEPVLASDTLSYLSDIDQLQSPCNDRLVNLSNSQLIESSSLSSRSPSGHQLVSNAEALSERFAPNNHSSSEDMYNDEEVETGFLDFQSPPSAQVPPPSPPASPDQTRATRITEPYWLSPDPITPATSPVKQAVPVSPSMAVSTPASLKTRPTPPKDIPHKVSFDENGAAIPFIRPVFPDPIRDRSHVLGLSSRTLLRTCFRIGEALNAGSTALRTRKDAVIELYARVSYSERPAGSVKQHFHFADLFSPDKPPFLKGTYGLWKGVGLWDLDSKVFLGEKGKGKMARVVGRIGREEKTRGLEMTVLSIWEANWEDVGICKGHHCG